jgi:uncharacterized repeat protein (TIGR03833 family)
MHQTKYKKHFPNFQKADHIMDGKNRSDIRPGLHVDIVLKQDQRSGRLTRGIVQDVLTSAGRHPHGIKVRLRDGQVGRVKSIIEKGNGNDENQRTTA